MNLNNLVNKIDSLSWHFLVGIVIVLFGFLIYSNSFQGQLVMDDANVVKPEILSVLQNPNQKFRFGEQRIIADLTFAINYSLHQKEVFGYHVVNFGIHILNSFLVLIFVGLLFDTPAIKDSTLASHKRLIAATAALIFLTHPIQTMAVSYITQRYASLATLFYVLTMSLFLYGRNTWLQYKQVPKTDKKLLISGVLAIWLLALVTFLLGIHTKAIVGTVPLMIFASEWLLYRRGRVPLIWLVPVAIAAMLIFYLGTQLHSLEFMFFFRKPNAMDEVITPFNYLPTQFKVLLIYIRKLLVPYGLNADYYVPVSNSFLDFLVGLGLVVWLSLIGFIWKWRRSRPLLSFGLSWFIVTPLITSSIIPILDVINEYRMYLPMVGISLLLAVGIWQLGQKIPPEWVGFGVIGLVLLYGVLTFNRNYVYQDELSFWGDVIQKSPYKARGYVNYAVKLHTTGQAEEAMHYYQQALEIDPDRLTALTNLGVLYTQLGEFDRAEELFDKALTVDPNYMDAINAKGVIYLNTGDFTRAKEYFDKVLAIDPNNNSALSNLALLGQKRDANQ